jgi:RNA polymerase sigma-70 factor (ECF subfamily)
LGRAGWQRRGGAAVAVAVAIARSGSVIGAGTMEEAVDAPSPPTDEHLLAQIAGGVDDQFDLFVDRHKRPLMLFVYHRIGDVHRSEDLTQEVFLKAFTAARDGRWQAGGSVKAWLFSIARNAVTDYVRTRAHRVTVLANSDARPPTDAPAPDDDGPLAAAVYAESARRVAALVRLLPPEQREVVALKVFGGLTFGELAAAVGAPEPTVKTRMQLAARKLRELWPLRRTDHASP